MPYGGVPDALIQNFFDGITLADLMGPSQGGDYMI